MKATELADGCVKHIDWLIKYDSGKYGWDGLTYPEEPLSAEDVGNDGRVVLAMLQKAREKNVLTKVYAILMSQSSDWSPLADPVAINAACLQALGGSDVNTD